MRRSRRPLSLEQLNRRTARPRRPRVSSSGYGLYPSAARAPIKRKSMVPKHDRKWIGRVAIASLSFILGILSGYFGDLARLAVPPGVLLDSTIGDILSATVLQERDPPAQGVMWIYPGRLSVDHPEVAAHLAGRFQALDPLDAAMRELGAIDVSYTKLKVIVEGHRNQAVRIVGMRALITSRTPPVQGYTLIGPGPEGEGQSVPIAFNLDEPDPIARVPNPGLPWGFEDFFGGPAFADYTVSLAKGEQQVFEIGARTKNYDVRWTIELTVLVDGEERRFTADINGKPIETSALLIAGDPSLKGPMGADISRYAEVYKFSMDTRQTFDRLK